MDELINQLEKLNINESQIKDNSLDSLIDNFNKIQISEEEIKKPEVQQKIVKFKNLLCNLLCKMKAYELKAAFQIPKCIY